MGHSRSGPIQIYITSVCLVYYPISDRIKLEFYYFKTFWFRFYRGSAAALVVFDITNPKTFESLDTWMGEIDKYADKEIVLMLVGNKSDMAKTRAVDYSTANKYASRDNFYS